jgi:hypothetical protein
VSLWRPSSSCIGECVLFACCWKKGNTCTSESAQNTAETQELNESLKEVEWSSSLWEEQTRLKETNCRVLHRADSKLPWQPQTDRQTDRQTMESSDAARYNVSWVSRAWFCWWEGKHRDLLDYGVYTGEILFRNNPKSWRWKQFVLSTGGHALQEPCSLQPETAYTVLERRQNYVNFRTIMELDGTR